MVFTITAGIRFFILNQYWKKLQLKPCNMAFLLAWMFLCTWLTIVIQRVVSLFCSVKLPCSHLDILSFMSRKLGSSSLSLCQKVALGLWKVASLLESQGFILLACITAYLLYVIEAHSLSEFSSSLQTVKVLVLHCSTWGFYLFLLAIRTVILCVIESQQLQHLRFWPLSLLFQY